MDNNQSKNTKKIGYSVLASSLIINTVPFDVLALNINSDNLNEDKMIDNDNFNNDFKVEINTKISTSRANSLSNVFNSIKSITIADSNLAKAINKQLNRDLDANITVADLESLTSLDLSYSNISNISGLEYAINLESLDLKYNNIENISNLSNLVNLKVLSLSDNLIKDITPISSLSNLENLYLDGNTISSVRPLTSLSKLNTLNLDYCLNSKEALVGISDIRSLKKLSLRSSDLSDSLELANLTNLTHLNVSSSRLTDLTFLSGLNNLVELDLSGNDIEDYSNLAIRTSIETLNLSFNNIADIEFLQNLNSLNSVSLQFNNINDISPLSGKNLINLDLYENEISNNSATVLSGFRNLETLNIGANKITTVDSFKDITSLKEINISENNISNINEISSLVNLERLELKEVNVDDFDFLSSFTKLEELDISNNDIHTLNLDSNLQSLISLTANHSDIYNLVGLSNLTNLEYLYLDDNNITDISDFSNLRNLKYLTASSNRISNVDALKNLSKLKSLCLANNDIENVTSLNSIVTLEELNISDNNIDSIENLNSLKNLTFLNILGCRIRNINVIENFTNLFGLYASCNSIYDLSPVFKLPNLAYADLSNNSISNIDCIKGLNSISSLDLSFNQISDISVLKDLDMNDDIIIDISNQNVNLADITLESGTGIIENKILNHLGQKVQLYNLPDFLGSTTDNDLSVSNLENGRYELAYSFTSEDSYTDLGHPQITFDGTVTQTLRVGREEFSPLVLNLSKDIENWTNSNVTILATVENTNSRLKKIILPDDSFVTRDTATYEVSANGDYMFKVESVDGIINTYSINVSNIDKVLPQINVSVTDNGTKKVLNITANDSESGVKKVILPDSTEVEASETTYEITSSGEYNFKVIDNAGNVSTTSYKITAPSSNGTNELPVITANDVTIYKNDVFVPKDYATAYDKEDGVITDRIEVVLNEVIPSTPGKYNVTYQVKDNNNEVSIKTIVVTVLEREDSTNTKPVFNFDDLIFNAGDSGFNILKGIKAHDNEDGDITHLIDVIDTDVNISKPGIYSATYRVTDKHGASTTATRNIIINAYPVIALKNPITNKHLTTNKFSILLNSVYHPLLFVSASDEEDGILDSSKIEIVSDTVNVAKEGSYKIVYRVTDKHGASTTKELTINVYGNDYLPRIVLSDNVISIKLGSKFNPLDYILATDKTDGNILDKVVVSNNVNENIPGAYSVTYTVTNSLGLTSTESLTVNVLSNTTNNSNNNSGTTSGNNSSNTTSGANGSDSTIKPQTGDDMKLELTMLISSGLALVGLNKNKKKDSKKK